MALRKNVSDGCEKLIWDFFAAGGQVVIYDANNGKHETRNQLAEKFDKEGIHVIMLGENIFQLHLEVCEHVDQSHSATTRRSSRATSVLSRSPLRTSVHPP
jgi:hypothetical protein